MGFNLTSNYSVNSLWIISIIITDLLICKIWYTVCLIYIQRIVSLAEIIYFKKATFFIDRSSLGGQKRHSAGTLFYPFAYHFLQHNSILVAFGFEALIVIYISIPKNRFWHIHTGVSFRFQATGSLR